MNQSIFDSASPVCLTNNKAKESWKQYEDLAQAYRKNSIKELLARTEIEDGFLRPEAAEIVLDTTYDDFDEDLINDLMLEHYGNKRTVDFAVAYNQYASDFNSILVEYI